MSNLSTSHSVQIPVLDNALTVDFARLPVHPSVISKAKRIIDILGAQLGLGITLILIIPIAIAIVMNNPGSIFYSQIRYGLNGCPFRIWKFRSMTIGADRLKHLVNNEAKGHYIFKNENDPRITRVGRFLRRTSLDELPSSGTCCEGK